MSREERRITGGTVYKQRRRAEEMETGSRGEEENKMESGKEETARDRERRTEAENERMGDGETERRCGTEENRGEEERRRGGEAEKHR